MTVTELNANYYRVRTRIEGVTTWGNVSILVEGKRAEVMAHTDFGTYAYWWTNTGVDPWEFLLDLGFQYGMKKMAGRSLYVECEKKNLAHIKKSIIGERKLDGLTKKEAREAWEDMTCIAESYGAGDVFRYELYNHDLFEKVFEYHERLPCEKVYSPQCLGFWKQIWEPLMEHLKADLERGA